MVLKQETLFAFVFFFFCSLHLFVIVIISIIVFIIKGNYVGPKRNGLFTWGNFHLSALAKRAEPLAC